MYRLKHISNINNEDLYFARLVISVTWVQQHFLENGPACFPRLPDDAVFLFWAEASSASENVFATSIAETWV